MKNFFIVLMAAAATGCATKGTFQSYEGIMRPDTEQARVIVPHPGGGLGMLVGATEIRISCVDGKSTGKFFGYNNFALFSWAPEVVLTPGRHNLAVSMRSGSLYGGQTVWIDAEAGRTYYVRHEIGGGGPYRSIHVQLQDKDTGKLVSRVMDKQPDPKDAEVPAEKRCRA